MSRFSRTVNAGAVFVLSESALLQEATRPDVVAALAERTGMHAWQSFGRQSLAFLSRRPIDDRA